MDADKEKRFRFRMRFEQEQQQGQQSAESQDMSGSFPEARDLMASDASLGSKAWNALQIPSQMASRGLNAIAAAIPEPEPTGNIPLDLVRDIPHVAVTTMAEAAPGFINRASLLTAGAAKGLQTMRPVGNVVGRGIANQWESLTGSMPGSLPAAWNDASLIFAKGKQAARPLYEAGKTGSKTAENLRKIPLKEDFINVAEKLAEKGKLPPESALEGRKIAGKLLSKGGGRYTEDYLRGLTDKFGGIAKSNESISEADRVYRRGLMAQSLRNLFPQNKYGGASAFKLAIMAALKSMGVAGQLAGAAISPATAGVTATAGGLISKVTTNPAASVTGRQVYEQYIQNRLNGDQQ